MMARIASDRRGFTLFEMVVYIAVFTVGVNLFVSVLSTGARLGATTTLQLHRVAGIRAVQSRFVHFVRQGGSVVPGAGPYQTGEDVVVLRMPDESPGSMDAVVLGAVRDKQHFSVLGLALADDGTWSQVYGETVHQPLKRQVFQVSTDGPRPVVFLEAQIAVEDGEIGVRPVIHRIRAVPRGWGGARP